jgi:glucosamine-6-phosphate deaminase
MLRRDLAGVPFLAPDVDGEEPEVAASFYGRTIDDGGLDLAVVGLGGNGHLGMNEPGSSPLSETRVVDLARSTSAGALRYGATIEPRWGITVGLRQLMEARELWLVVTGGHKSEILRQTLGDPIGPGLPATFLREHHNAWLLADSAAMSH